MKTIGLIGGLSWESSALYYRHINEIVRERRGGLHSAKLLLWSFDFAEVAERQHEGDWDGAKRMMVDAAKRLEGAGADCIGICTNTMHIMAEDVQAASGVPLIHIADAAGTAARRRGIKRPALLGTRFTMEKPFYAERLREKHDLDVLTPDEAGRKVVHDTIYNELCQGLVRPESKAAYLGEIGRLRERGADAVILGCTEIVMLIGQEDTDLPVLDTTRLHAEALAEFALVR